MTKLTTMHANCTSLDKYWSNTRNKKHASFSFSFSFFFSFFFFFCSMCERENGKYKKARLNLMVRHFGHMIIS